MKRLVFATWLVALVFLSGKAFAQTKKSADGTLGTAQMAGGDAVFGKTYTVGSNGGLYNVTIVKAEYSVARHNFSNSVAVIPKADEKLLILHLKIKNPLPHDEYLSGTTLTFSTVGSDDITHDQAYDLRLASAKSGRF